MSSASMTFGRPRQVWRHNLHWSAIGASMLRVLRRVDAWLDHRSDDPQTPQEVLDWAQRIEQTDPGLASDLRGAALRAMD